MLSEIEIIYVILAIQAIGMLVITTFYSLSRLRIEEARSKALEQQRDDLGKYYDSRLSIEKAKLDVERAKLDIRRGNNNEV